AVVSHTTTAPTEPYTLSLHDALPILRPGACCLAYGIAFSLSLPSTEYAKPSRFGVAFLGNGLYTDRAPRVLYMCTRCALDVGSLSWLFCCGPPAGTGWRFASVLRTRSRSKDRSCVLARTLIIVTFVRRVTIMKKLGF